MRISKSAVFIEIHSFQNLRISSKSETKDHLSVVFNWNPRISWPKSHHHIYHVIKYSLSNERPKSTMSMLMFSFWTIWWIGSNVPSGHRAHARLCTNVCASVNLQIKQTWQMSASFLYMTLVWMEYGENIPTAGSFHYSGGWPRSNFLHPNKVNGHVCTLHTSEALFQSSLTGKLGGYWRKQRIINSFSRWINVN